VDGIAALFAAALLGAVLVVLLLIRLGVQDCASALLFVPIVTLSAGSAGWYLTPWATPGVLALVLVAGLGEWWRDGGGRARTGGGD
jgi:hypothetical protein